MDEEKAQQGSPRSVRLYPPVEARLTKEQEDNFNWYVNYLFAEAQGIPEEHIKGFRRNKGK